MSSLWARNRKARLEKAVEEGRRAFWDSQLRDACPYTVEHRINSGGRVAPGADEGCYPSDLRESWMRGYYKAEHDAERIEKEAVEETRLQSEFEERLRNAIRNGVLKEFGL